MSPRSTIGTAEIYRRISFDKIVNKETEELGWRTTSKTKPMMVSDLDQMMRENAPWELSKDGEVEVGTTTMMKRGYECSGSIP